MQLNGDFIIIPRILFNDKSLSSTDRDLMGLIISLTAKNNYCFASNNYLAKYINKSKRTITSSLSKLRCEKYIIIKYVDGCRRIYLNTEKVPIKSSFNIEKPCYKGIEKNSYHNINKNKINNNKNKSDTPYWITNPEVCKSKPATQEEILELQNRLNKYK